MTQEEDRRIKNLEISMREHRHKSIDGTLPVVQSSFITFSLASTTAQTATNYALIFTATFPCSVFAVSETHSAAGTDASAVTLQIERLTGTQALAAGTVLLNTAINLKGTADTAQRANLINQTGLKIGDRLALRVAGVLTSLSGVQVTIELRT